MNNQTELPKGYSIQQDICSLVFFIQKDGTILRRANKQPIAFGINERDQAIRYAWWHHGEENKCSTTSN